MAESMTDNPFQKFPTRPTPEDDVTADRVRLATDQFMRMHIAWMARAEARSKRLEIASWLSVAAAVIAFGVFIVVMISKVWG
jgi:hypothetical protein